MHPGHVFKLNYCLALPVGCRYLPRSDVASTRTVHRRPPADPLGNARLRPHFSKPINRRPALPPERLVARQLAPNPATLYGGSGAGLAGTALPVVVRRSGISVTFRPCRAVRWPAPELRLSAAAPAASVRVPEMIGTRDRFC